MDSAFLLFNLRLKNIEQFAEVLNLSKRPETLINRGFRGVFIFFEKCIMNRAEMQVC